MTEEIKFKLSSEDSSILSKVFGPVNANINQIQDYNHVNGNNSAIGIGIMGKYQF